MTTNALLWSPRVKAMFGYPADAVVKPEDFVSGLHPDDRERVNAAYFAATDAQLRPPYDVEYRAIGKTDGRMRWIAAKGRAVFDESGRCVRVIGTALDISQRKADEERLRELNETLERRFAETLAERKLLADIVEGTDIFVQVCDRDYNWLAINRASAEEFAKIFNVARPKAGDNMLRASRRSRRTAPPSRPCGAVRCRARSSSRSASSAAAASASLRDALPCAARRVRRRGGRLPVRQ